MQEEIESSDAFLTTAKDSAESQVRIWIRSVLRETALQAVRLQWTVRVGCGSSTNNKNSSSNNTQTEQDGTGSVVEVHLESDVIANAQNVCRNVAHKWMDKLKEMGLHDVARWIDEIVRAENKFLFQDPSSQESVTDRNSENREDRSGEKTALASAHAVTTESIATTTTTTTTTTTITTRKKAADDPSRQSDEKQKPQFTTTWAKLRHMGQRDILSGENPPENVVLDTHQRLDVLGAQNATYWPADQWNIVQEAAADINNRLYSNVPTQRAENEEEALQSSSSHHPLHDSTASTHQGPYPQALEYLLLRKRSKRRRVAKRPAAIDQTSNPSNAEEAQSREASADNGHFRLSWENDILADNVWSAKEKAQLDALLHDNHSEVEAEEEPQSLLLGSLQDLGRFHYFYQLPQDYDEGVGMLDQWQEKQKRRRQNEALSVRLGDHVKLRTGETEYEKIRASRVARTAEVTTNPRRWLDVDMGYCMLESVDATTGHRTLYAFGNLELFLLDEDIDVGGS